MTKRLIAILAALCVLLSACGAAPAQPDATDPPSPAPTQTIEPTAEPQREAVVEDVRGSIAELADLYGKAAELSARYAVNVFIADTVPESLGTEAFTDRDWTDQCLDLIDAALGCYPDGFFRAMPYAQYDRIYLYLTGTGGFAGTYWPSENALCIQIDANCAISGSDFFNYTLHHELFHMIDGRLHDTPSIDEKAWMSYDPEGFEYAGRDDEAQMAVYDGCYEYFVDSYGTCSAEEDRAEVFGEAMAWYQDHDRTPCSMDMPQVADKLGYLCRCMRAEFAFADLAELPWESALAAANQSGK